MVERDFPWFTDRGTDKKTERNWASRSSSQSDWGLGRKQANSACIHHQEQQGQLQVGTTRWDVSQGAVSPLNAGLPHFSILHLTCSVSDEEKEGNDAVGYITVLSALLISLTVPLLGMWRDPSSHSTCEHLQPPAPLRTTKCQWLLQGRLLCSYSLQLTGIALESTTTYLVLLTPAVWINACYHILNNHHVKVARDRKASTKTFRKYVRSKRKTEDKTGFTIKRIIK